MGCSSQSKAECDYQQQQPDSNASTCAVELGNGCYESTVAILLESDGLHHCVDRLEEVNEKEHHKVEARIVAKCLISGSEPNHQKERDIML